MGWLFVHIPRTGGTSLRAALRDAGDAYGAAGSHRDHAGVREQIASMGRQAWDDARTFSIVRDPFARLVSCWAFAFAEDPQRVMDPKRFRQWIVDGCRLPNRFNLHLDFGRRRWMHAPQVEWLTDEDGELAVSTLFRLEQLEAEWSDLLGCIGLAALKRVHTNGSDHLAVAAYYDERSAESVRSRYAEDFRALGYRAD